MGTHSVCVSYRFFGCSAVRSVQYESDGYNWTVLMCSSSFYMPRYGDDVQCKSKNIHPTSFSLAAAAYCCCVLSTRYFLAATKAQRVSVACIVCSCMLCDISEPAAAGAGAAVVEQKHRTLICEQFFHFVCAQAHDANDVVGAAAAAAGGAGSEFISRWMCGPRS